MKVEDLQKRRGRGRIRAFMVLQAGWQFAEEGWRQLAGRGRIPGAQLNCNARPADQNLAPNGSGNSTAEVRSQWSPVLCHAHSD